MGSALFATYDAPAYAASNVCEDNVPLTAFGDTRLEQLSFEQLAAVPPHSLHSRAPHHRHQRRRSLPGSATVLNHVGKPAAQSDAIYSASCAQTNTTLSPGHFFAHRLSRSGVSGLTAAEQQLLLTALEQNVCTDSFMDKFPLTTPQTKPGMLTHQIPCASEDALPAIALAYPRSRSYPSEGEEAAAAHAAAAAGLVTSQRVAQISNSDSRRNSEPMPPPSQLAREPDSPTAAVPHGASHSVNPHGGLRSRRGLSDLHQVRGGRSGHSGGGFPVTRFSPTGKRDAEGNVVSGTTPRSCRSHKESPFRGPPSLPTGAAGRRVPLSPEAVLAVELGRMMGVDAALMGAAGGMGGMACGGGEGMGARDTTHAGGGHGDRMHGLTDQCNGGSSDLWSQQQMQQQSPASSFDGWSMSTERQTTSAAAGTVGDGNGSGGGGSGGSTVSVGVLGSDVKYSSKPRSIAERMRREKITARLQTLKEVLPKMDAKTDTSAMLEDAVVYIQSLQARCKALERHNSSLVGQLRDYGVTPATPLVCGGSSGVASTSFGQFQQQLQLHEQMQQQRYGSHFM